MPDEPNTPNPAEAFNNLLSKHNNDGVKLASQLFDENFQYRQQIRELKANAPKEGSVTLSPDDAKAWKAYQELGVEPKEIKKALDRLPNLEKENKELAGMESLRELADIGLDGSKLKLSVLKDLIAKYPDAVIRSETQKDKDGKEAKVAFIKTGDKESPFAEFAAQNLSDYLPALKVNAVAQPLIPGNTHDPKPDAGGASSFFDRNRQRLEAEFKEKATPPVDINARFGKTAAA